MLAPKKQRIAAVPMPRPSACTFSFRLLHSVVFLALIAQMSTIVSCSSILSSAQHQSSEDNEGMQITASLREDEDVQESLSGESLIRRKRGIHDPTFWPNRIIPFIYTEPFSRRHKRQVMRAIGVWERRTCVRFVDRTNEEYFARFEISTFSCESLVGLKRFVPYQNHGQGVYLTEQCLKKRGYVIHELGHLIGLYHEHQRPDRDNYMRINYENVAKMEHYQEFEKYDFTTYGPYDFKSVMQYPLNQFAKNSTVSMEVLPNVTIPEDVEVGLRHSVSYWDRRKARRMYRCKEQKKLPLPPPMVQVEEPSGDNIYTGELVALLIKGMVGDTSFPDNSWLSCTQQQCTVNNCPGKFLRESDKDSCPFNTFTLHKLSSSSSGAVVRVGDAIVLEHRMAAETGPVIQDKSFFVSCSRSTLVCSLSLVCTADVHEFNITSQCRENVLIVRAEGKEEGTPITHKDLIGFEYMSNHNEIFSQQCAFGCNPVTSVCAKEVCVSNSLDPVTSPRCGKDLFLIQKF